MLDGPVDCDAFRVYVHKVLGPILRRGDLVILDRLPTHRVAGIGDSLDRFQLTECVNFFKAAGYQRSNLKTF